MQEQQTREDIISLDGSNPDIDLVYQSDTTFTDIAQQMSPPNLQNPLNTSTDKNQHNNQTYVTVTQTPEQVTLQNTNDDINIAKLVDQVVTSRGEQQILHDSMHTPKGPSVVNLSSKDL